MLVIDKDNFINIFIVQINDITYVFHFISEVPFIGISDTATEGTWVSDMTGQPITYTNWGCMIFIIYD